MRLLVSRRCSCSRHIGVYLRHLRISAFDSSLRTRPPHDRYPLCYKRTMTCEENEAALSGSRARGDAWQDSDTDIMIEIDPGAPVTIYDHVPIKEYVAGLFDGPVDVVDGECLRPYVRPAVNVGIVIELVQNS